MGVNHKIRPHIPEFRRKPKREVDPNWLPTQWMKEALHLRCEHCGEKIKLDGLYYMVTTWEEGEKMAELSRNNHEKNCSALEEAKRIMKLYREKHPNITFEEATEVYKLILLQLKQ